MKFFHLADLHLGKRVNGFPMAEDQKYILDQILSLVDQEAPGGIIIAGDVYDKAIPSVEAVNLFDDFLAALVSRRLQVFVISGNHDSAERLSYGGRVMEKSGIHFPRRITGRTDDSGAGNKKSSVTVVPLEDEYGSLSVCLIPYIHPSIVREVYPEETVSSWTQAMEVLIQHAGIDPAGRNIAVAHQYVTASGVRPQESDSEQRHIGGLDNVDMSVFENFDYVALGHLHGPQSIGRETVRYAGSPLKYSFSEENQQKSVTVVEIREKGRVGISRIPLQPARDLKTVKGLFRDIMSPEFTASLSADDYYRIILTDEYDVDHAMSRLRKYFYENLMEIDYDNSRTRSQGVADALEEALEKEPVEVLQELYQKQNGTAMSAFQMELARKLIGAIWGEE